VINRIQLFGPHFIIGLLMVVACSQERKEQQVVYEEEEVNFEVSYSDLGKAKLSEYDFFVGKLSEMNPADNVFPYELNSSLFTDYALKKRFVFIPKGKQAVFQEKEVLDFPVGTVLIKNFYYEDGQLQQGGSTIIETRLLVHKETGWIALPYIWDDEQNDASLQITGGERNISLIGKGSFTYSIPNMAQCKSCHELNGTISPIGPSARQLNKSVNGVNQLSMLESADVLAELPQLREIVSLPVWNNVNSGTLEERARAYLEINCAHCHRPEGPAKNSGLDLTIFSESDHSLGIFKGPVAAGAGSGGHKFDIVPGKPEESILTYRMESNDPGVMMPELGRKLAHQEGIKLIKDWIRSMN